MYQSITAIPSDVRERIVQAANELYEQSGKQSFPTVDQVRRNARVDMNAASSVMKDWRRSQTAQASPVAVQVPDVVIQANNQVLVALWAQAQELANESLRSAQSAWDSERIELDEMRQELAQAYESQAAEFDQLKNQSADALLAHNEAEKQVANELATTRSELALALTRAERAEAQAVEIERRATDLRGELEKAHEEMDQVRTSLAQALARAERAEAQAGEIEHRAADLRGELDRAHEEIDQVRTALAEQQKLVLSVITERDQAKSELTKAVATSEAQATAHNEQRNTAAQELAKQVEQHAQALQAAADAREHAAELSGKLSAIQEQNVALLARLVPESSNTTKL